MVRLAPARALRGKGDRGPGSRDARRGHVAPRADGVRRALGAPPRLLLERVDALGRLGPGQVGRRGLVARLAAEGLANAVAGHQAKRTAQATRPVRRSLREPRRSARPLETLILEKLTCPSPSPRSSP